MCKNTAGNTKDHKEVLMIHASAAVTVPFLEFSKNSIGYEYSYEPGVPLVHQSQAGGAHATFGGLILVHRIIRTT